MTEKKKTPEEDAQLDAEIEAMGAELDAMDALILADPYAEHRDNKGKFLKGNKGYNGKETMAMKREAMENAITAREFAMVQRRVLRIALKSRSEERVLTAYKLLNDRYFGRVKEYHHIETVDKTVNQIIDPTKLSPDELETFLKIIDKMDTRIAENLKETA